MPTPVKPPTAPPKAGLLVEGGIVPIEAHYMIDIIGETLGYMQRIGLIKALPPITLHSPAVDRVELKVELPPSAAEIKEIMQEVAKAIWLIFATAVIGGGLVGGVSVYYLTK